MAAIIDYDSYFCVDGTQITARVVGGNKGCVRLDGGFNGSELTIRQMERLIHMLSAAKQQAAIAKWESRDADVHGTGDSGSSA